MGRKTKEELQQLRDFGKILFIRENLTAKEIAERINISEVTVGKWRKEDKWDSLKVTLTQTREEQLRSLYEQLGALNEHINNKPDGKRFPDAKEADAQLKLTKAIEYLERETNVGELIDSYMQLLQYLRNTEDYDLAKKLAPKIDALIKGKL